MQLLLNSARGTRAHRQAHPRAECERL